MICANALFRRSWRRKLSPVALRFGVAVSSVVKWSQRYLATGSGRPDKMGWAPQAGARRASGLHPGTPQADAASDVARAQGRTCHARRNRLAQRGLAIPAARGTAVQKKRCLVLSRVDPTSSSGDGAGGHGREASTLAAWSSSTRLGSRPIWRRCGVGVLRVTVRPVSRRMVTGGQ
jgi:hypothetical protein